MLRRRDRRSDEGPDRARGEGATPAGKGATPAGKGATPAGKGVPPARKGARSAGKDATQSRRAEPKPEDMTADLETQAADYLADNDVWMYGSNAPAVVAVLDRLEAMGPKEAAPLADAWLAAPKAERGAARKDARKAVEVESDTERHLQMARESVATWLAVAAGYPEFVKTEPDWPSMSAQVAEAALDVLTALIMEADLDEVHRTTLMAPWAGTIGREKPAGEREPAAPNAEADTDEAEAEGKFGPNTDAVVDLVNRLWLLTPEQTARLVGRWQRTLPEDLRIAHEMLHDVVEEDPEWRDQVRRAQELLVPWLNGGRVEEASGFLGQTGQPDMRRMAGPVLADAVAALVVGDLLEPEDAATLYGPWFDLVGAPALPVAQDEDKNEKGSAAGSQPTRG